MKSRIVVILLLLSGIASGGIVEDVRAALAQNNVSLAELELQEYRAHHAATPEYLEAVSWMARNALASNQLGPAQTFAGQVESGAAVLLKQRKLDAESHLPLALGAAIEVKAGVLAARGQKANAVAFLKKNLVSYRGTSIESRLQKNLNLLTLQGTAAPPLRAEYFLGPKPPTLAQVKGLPVLLFFWAHWCPDCKNEGPIIANLRSEFGPKGLAVLAPTQLYGYAARGEDAKPKDELAYITQVWQRFYPGLQEVSVPVSKENFVSYGASTTPTLVLLDREGKVALYHPGVMSYSDLKSSIQKVLGQ